MSGTNKTAIYQCPLDHLILLVPVCSISVIVAMNLARADKGEGASILLVLVLEKSWGSLQWTGWGLMRGRGLTSFIGFRRWWDRRWQRLWCLWWYWQAANLVQVVVVFFLGWFRCCGDDNNLGGCSWCWHLLGNDQPHNQVCQKDAMSSLAWHLAGDI